MPGLIPVVNSSFSDWNLSGGGGDGWWTSGISPVSSVSGLSPTGVNTSGPWFIEDQTMSIYYARVPISQRDTLPNRDVTLSSVDTSALGKVGNIGGTFVLASVIGRCTGTVVKYVFGGPYIQPQKFQLDANEKDYQGVSYGSVSAGNMGPGGNISTSQPFYQRRLARAGDVDYTENCFRGFTYQIVDSYPVGTGQTMFMNRHKKWIGWGNQGSLTTFLGECAGIDFYDPELERSGAYSTSQDYPVDARVFTDSCGSRLRDGRLWDFKLKGITTDGAIVALTHYDVTRHDYS